MLDVMDSVLVGDVEWDREFEMFSDEEFEFLVGTGMVLFDEVE